MHLCQKTLLSLVARICFQKEWEKRKDVLINIQWVSFCAWLSFPESEALRVQKKPEENLVPWNSHLLTRCPQSNDILYGNQYLKQIKANCCEIGAGHLSLPPNRSSFWGASSSVPEFWKYSLKGTNVIQLPHFTDAKNWGRQGNGIGQIVLINYDKSKLYPPPPPLLTHCSSDHPAQHPEFLVHMDSDCPGLGESLTSRKWSQNINLWAERLIPYVMRSSAGGSVLITNTCKWLC